MVKKVKPDLRNNCDRAKLGEATKYLIKTDKQAYAVL